VKVESEDIEVQIEAVGGSTPATTDDGVPMAVAGSPAPSVYNLTLGIRTAPSVRTQGTITRTRP
jgi:hypothetical protein